MKLRKRTEITVETDEVLVVRRTRVYRAWCSECGQEVEMLGMDDADALSRRSRRGRQRGQGTGWHLCASGDTPLVCLPSLLKSL